MQWDPKDGELNMCRMKPGETLVEVRSGSDVQIDRQTCVKELFRNDIIYDF